MSTSEAPLRVAAGIFDILVQRQCEFLHAAAAARPAAAARWRQAEREYERALADALGGEPRAYAPRNI